MWSDAARAAALLARRRRTGKTPTVGQNRDEMAAMLRGSARLRRRAASAATKEAMLRAEMNAPGHERVGRPKPGMVEASPGTYQRRDVYARTLKAARAQVRARSSETTARGRNTHARVIAGRMAQASFKRRG